MNVLHGDLDDDLVRAPGLFHFVIDDERESSIYNTPQTHRISITNDPGIVPPDTLKTLDFMERKKLTVPSLFLHFIKQ